MSDATGFAAILTRSFGTLQPLSPETISELFGHYELLLRWNKTLNLTSIAGLEEAVLRHYCESLFVGIHLPTNPVSILDLGSGGGFPGIPMAILRPDCRFTLAESHQRKAVFLREATRHLSSIRVVACRAEEIEGSFEWLVSRAVKWPEVLKIAVPAAAVRRFRTVALLMGQEDAADVVVQPNFAWREPIPLPWGHRRVLVLGQTASSGD
ncbi:MAG TPA: 16S rRNA (guanine(527)-N(7))-methyltransferase RsmG [Anaeromyxobacteraceae bacterium]|nr:16S rRNA (guanine(527)-N(7))-methyltransferase RsmG [Anaeromyxobacteraceae bacterium]